MGGALAGAVQVRRGLRQLCALRFLFIAYYLRGTDCENSRITEKKDTDASRFSVAVSLHKKYSSLRPFRNALSSIPSLDIAVFYLSDKAMNKGSVKRFSNLGQWLSESKINKLIYHVLRICHRTSVQKYLFSNYLCFLVLCVARYTETATAIAYETQGFYEQAQTTYELVWVLSCDWPVSGQNNVDVI